ncbi:TVP38/TMEM64 family protein [Phormidium tenue FACHB-886]|nr:TVP38/TMEM64 family protein [Phormidium tenue FACHB-886]
MRISAKKLQKLLVALVFLILVYGLMVIALKAIGLENVQLWVQQAGVLAPVLFVGLCAFSLMLAPLSGSSLFVVGGAVFGKEIGFVLSYLGTILGCSLNFAIARHFGRQIAMRFVGKTNLDALDKFIQRLSNHHEFLYLTLVLLIAQDIISYAAGLTRIRFHTFLMALLVSAAVSVAAYIYLGSSLLESVVKEG